MSICTYTKRFFNIAFLSVILSLMIESAAYAIECGMSPAFKQRDNNAKKGFTTVWSDKNISSLLFIESLNVNTDGTRRSYSIEDFWGEKNALNNLCNAMRDECKGLSQEELRNRRIITQKAFANGWPNDQLKNTKISASVIPFKDEKPCPLVDGFLVSSTTLHKPNISDVCDIDNYVDALKIPAIVLPKNPSKKILSEFAKRNADVGDLAVVMVPGTSQPVYAVVGDKGPVNELGEGSIALNGKLLGKKNLPINYFDVRGRGKYKGNQWVVPQAIVIVFPGTRDKSNPFMTSNRINEAAQKHFDSWGGIERMKSCASTYPR